MLGKQIYRHKLCKKNKTTTRLLVSGRSPECSDCLMVYGAVISLKKHKKN